MSEKVQLRTGFPCFKYIMQTLQTQEDVLIFAKEYFSVAGKQGIDASEAMSDYISLRSLLPANNQYLKLTEYRGNVLPVAEFRSVIMADSDVIISKNCRNYAKERCPEALRPDNAPTSPSLCIMCPAYRMNNNRCEGEELLLLRYMFTGKEAIEHIQELCEGSIKKLFRSYLDLTSDMGVMVSSGKPVIVAVTRHIATKVMAADAVFFNISFEDPEKTLSERFQYVLPSLVEELLRKSPEISGVLKASGIDETKFLENVFDWFLCVLKKISVPALRQADGAYERILHNYDTIIRRNDRQKSLAKQKRESTLWDMNELFSSMGLEKKASVSDDPTMEKAASEPSSAYEQTVGKATTSFIDISNRFYDASDNVSAGETKPDIKSEVSDVSDETVASEAGSGEVAEDSVRISEMEAAPLDPVFVSAPEGIYLPFLSSDLLAVCEPRSSLGFLISSADSTKLLPIEIVVDENSDLSLFSYDMVNRRFYCFTDKDFEDFSDLKRILLSRKITKVCWQPYYIHALCLKYGLLIRSVHSIMSAEQFLQPGKVPVREVSVAFYADKWRLATGTSHGQYDNDLLDTLQYYGYVCLSQQYMMQDCSDEEAGVKAFDAVLGRSFMKSAFLDSTGFSFFEKKGELVFDMYGAEDAYGEPFYKDFPVKEPGCILSFQLSDLSLAVEEKKRLVASAFAEEERDVFRAASEIRVLRMDLSTPGKMRLDIYSVVAGRKHFLTFFFLFFNREVSRLMNKRPFRMDIFTVYAGENDSVAEWPATPFYF